VFHFGEELFHTGGFIESLATQTLVLFAMIGLVVPYSPIAAALGLKP
jgi:hypothetical protein